MKIIMIGSSNAHGFVRFLKDEEKGQIDVQKFESFRVKMEKLEESEKKVLGTVIKNFFCGFYYF